MTSSRSFELELVRGARVLSRIAVQDHEIPARRALNEGVSTDRQLKIRVRRSVADVQARLLLGIDLVGVLRPGTNEITVDVSVELREQYGEAIFAIEEVGPEGEDSWTPVLELAVPLIASPALERLYEQIISDLEAVHVGLARDVVGRTGHRRRSEPGRIFEPEPERQRLETSYAELSQGLAKIGVQPATNLVRERRLARWRIGDIPEPWALADLPRDPETLWEGDRPVRLGRIAIRTPRLTTDLPEHRHLRAGILLLARRARALATNCYRAANLLREEERAWGHGRQGRSSIFEERDLPRIRKLEAIAAAGEDLENRFRELISRYGFLAQAGMPRTRFGPTPLFLGGRGYQECYRVLRASRQDRGILVDGQAVRITFRSLDKLFEYWTYVRAVGVCRELLGPVVESRDGYQLFHEIYRPELVPGQSFTWQLEDGGTVELYYEPAIPPSWSSEPTPLGWRASLVGAPLRPDVVLVVRRGRELRALALDAKSTAHFEKTRLFDVSDYRTLVYETAEPPVAPPGEGEAVRHRAHEESRERDDRIVVRQPIRQLFLVHRDRTTPPFCSLPGYLEGRCEPDRAMSILGAVPLLPGHEDLFRTVIGRFLELD